MRIREAAAADADRCAELHILARRRMPYLPAAHTAEATQAWMRDIVFPGEQVWVAEVDGLAVAYAALADGFLSNLYVDPAHQGCGIGAALLACVKQAAAPGPLQLWTFQENLGALRFYARHSFTEVRRTDGSGNAERVPDVLMRWSPTPAAP